MEAFLKAVSVIIEFHLDTASIKKIDQRLWDIFRKELELLKVANLAT
jgi:hypothetical protein